MPLLSNRKRTRNRALNAPAWLTLAGLWPLSSARFPRLRPPRTRSRSAVSDGRSEDRRGRDIGYFLLDDDKQFEDLAINEFHAAGQGWSSSAPIRTVRCP